MQGVASKSFFVLLQGGKRGFGAREGNNPTNGQENATPEPVSLKHNIVANIQHLELLY